MGVSVSIYDAFGQGIIKKVEKNTSLLKNFPMTMYWDGRSLTGQSLPSGLYKVYITWWTNKKKYTITKIVGIDK
jgi:flagellar hook assembly protein FlgD